MADFLAEWLRRLGYHATLTYTGLEALAQLRVGQPALVLVDLMMPGMGGWELVRRIRADARWSNLPVVICTARQDAHPSLDLVQGVLYKPFRFEEFAQMIHSALRN
jgi:CheY-like chemotaxis protein